VECRCIIVDDNLDFLVAARDLLTREGIEVVGLASTSAEAIAAVRDLQPDVVLVDFYLGDESGLELARRLRDGSGPGDPAIILISTYSERDLGELVVDTPAVAFLTKAELNGDSIRSKLNLAEG